MLLTGMDGTQQDKEAEKEKCGRCRKFTPKHEFLNRYGKALAWCSNCRVSVGLLRHSKESYIGRVNTDG